MVHRVSRALLEGAAHTSTALRQAIEVRAASASGSSRSGPTDEIPEQVGRYIDKVAAAAYKVTDEDFDGLRESGYTDDQLFEITLSAAFGAAVGRLERGLQALDEAKQNK